MLNSIFQSSRACWWACLIFLAAVALGSVSEFQFVGLDSTGNSQFSVGLKSSTGFSGRIIVTPPAPMQPYIQEVLGDDNWQQVTRGNTSGSTVGAQPAARQLTQNLCSPLEPNPTSSLKKVVRSALKLRNFSVLCKNRNSLVFTLAGTPWNTIFPRHATA